MLYVYRGIVAGKGKIIFVGNNLEKAEFLVWTQNVFR